MKCFNCGAEAMADRIDHCLACGTPYSAGPPPQVPLAKKLALLVGVPLGLVLLLLGLGRLAEAVVPKLLASMGPLPPLVGAAVAAAVSYVALTSIQFGRPRPTDKPLPKPLKLLALLVSIGVFVAVLAGYLFFDFAERVGGRR